MKFESYEITQYPEDITIFDFISIGPNGEIHKRICFCPTEYDNVFELAFGNVKSDGGIDFMAISNNNDRDKILATIALSIEVFLSVFPDQFVSFKGTTPARTRLYQMAIGLNLTELQKGYWIFGFYNGQLLPFEKNLTASAFYVMKRT